jgi:NitT/TauT family transport system ATP-binding protein
MLAAPDRIGVAAEVIRRTLDGRLKISPDGIVRASDRYLLVGRAHAARPDPIQAAWLYAQMVRWGHALMSPNLLAQAKAVFRPDIYDSILGPDEPMPAGEPADGVGAFTGPPFNPDDIAAHLGGWKIRRQ